VSAAVLLVRHTAVAQHWRGRCYGRSDIGLSRAGAAHARAVATHVAAWGPSMVVHSGLKRARILADHVARHCGLRSIALPAWQERDFGDWEGQSWAAIYRATGAAMDGMIDAPASFRPGGGETTDDLAIRAMAALDALPAGRIAVVTHGGPIAAIVGQSKGLPVPDWLSITPTLGELTMVERDWRNRARAARPEMV